MGTVVYLHGFASVGKSPKSDALAEAVTAKGHRFAAPDLPVDPEGVIDVVNRTINELTTGRIAEIFPFVFVGTSLGGFWARYFSARYDAPCVMVNPSVAASISIGKRLDQDVKNYVTGEPIVITRQILEQYLVAETYAKTNGNGAMLNLFVAKDDEILSAEAMLADIPFTASTTVMEDGGHRFEAHWDKVITKTLEILETA